MSKEILKACQPESLLNFKLGKMGALHAYTVNVRIDAHLTITIDNMENKSQRLKIIFYYNDNPFSTHPAWSFRFGTELVRNDLAYTEKDLTDVKDKEAYYYFKVENSEYIKWNDETSPFTSETFPDLTHYIFLTTDDVFEVLSLYEPKFVIKEK